MQTVSLLLLTTVCTTAVAGAGQLTIRLVGFTSDEGSAAYAMWSGPERWLGDGGTVTDGYASIEEGVSQIVIDDLPFGEYAVSAYHDRNSNEKLDTGLFRIPKEPLGTSNDAKIRFGPPRYTDAKFLFNEATMTIIVPIRKLF